MSKLSASCFKNRRTSQGGLMIGLLLSRKASFLSGLPLKLGVLVCFSASVFGCGYTFQGSGSVLPEDVKSVHIPQVGNLSPETKFTKQLTESLRDRFDRYGVVTVVESTGRADALLEAEIKQIQRATSTSTSSSDFALQNAITVTISASLKRKDTGQVLWSNQNMSITRVYGASGNTVVTSAPTFSAGALNAQDLNALNDRELARGQEKEVFALISDQVAQQVYEQAVMPEF
jgi:hypothetical protein